MTIQRILLTILAGIFFATALTAQEAQSLIKRESPAAVPDAPAFNALGSEPSDILRPSDIRTLALNISPFIQGGRFTLPKDFALEVSPGALIYRDRRINIEDYRNSKIYLAYNTAVSIGTGLDSANQMGKIAVGIRTTFINDADKFLNDAHRERIDNILKDNSAVFQAEWDKFKQAHNLPFDKEYDDDSIQGPDSTIYKQFLEEYQSLPDVQALVDKADKEFEQAHWNARRLDLALSLLSVSDESSTNNIMAKSLNMWLTFCAPIQKHGQIVLSLYTTAGFSKMERDSSQNIVKRPNVEVTGSMRIYAGVNKYKFFAEFQAGIKQDEHVKVIEAKKDGALSGIYPTSNFMVGAEVGIFNLAWVNLYGGIRDVGVKTIGAKGSNAYFRFDWKLTLPDWAKFRN